MGGVSAAEWVPPNADIEELRAAAVACKGCELWKPATQELWAAFCEVDDNGRARAASTRPPSAVKLADLFGN